MSAEAPTLTLASSETPANGAPSVTPASSLHPRQGGYSQAFLDRRFQKGRSGNPSGRGGWYAELRAQHRDNVPALLDALYDFALKQLKKESPFAVAATREYLDRIVGKVPQTIIAPDTAKKTSDELWAAMTDEQLRDVIASDGVLPDDADDLTAIDEPAPTKAAG